MYKIVLFITLFVVSSFAVFGTVSLDTPVASEIILGTYNFTASAGTDFNVTGCAFVLTDDGTIANISGNASSYSTNNDTSALTQSASTTVSVICYDASDGSEVSDSVSGVVIDNNDPSCSCDVGNQQVSLHDTIDYDCSASSDATTSMTFSCNATYDDSSVETQTGAINSFELTSVLGQASVLCRATDVASNTDVCSVLSVTVQGDGDGGGDVGAGVGISDNGIFAILAIAVVAVLMAGVGMSKGRGKKRR